MISKITPGLRFLLGLIFLAGGIGGLFDLMKPEGSEAALGFIAALKSTGYLWVLVKVTEIVCGLFLLANLWVPLMLIILFPVTLNILLFHAFLEHGMLVMAMLIMGLHLYLVLVNSKAYNRLFTMREPEKP